MNKTRRLKTLPCDILIVDTLNLCFRCVFTQGKLKHNDSSTGVIFGATNLIHSYLQKFTPKQVIMVGEGKHSRDRRREIFAGYKLGRKSNLPIPLEEFYSQVNYLQDLMYNLGVDYVAVDKFEADDTIAVLSKHYTDKNITIVSTDGDFLQLVRDNLYVYNPSTDIVITPYNFKEVVGVDVANFLSYKVIIGDSSDKIPGIRGCGPKIAKEIVEWMGYDLFVDAGYENIPKSLQKAFTPEAREQYELAYKLIDLFHVPLEIEEVLDKTIIGVYDSEEAKDLLEDCDCFSLLKKWDEIEETFGKLKGN
jgi:5'-3' exonuclease